MYTIIGGDGKEYGPVTVEQVRTWMSGGRANLATKVRAVGTDAWKTIAESPEITGSAPAAASGAANAPASNSPAAAIADRGIATLDVMGCYERSWTLLKSNFWPLVGVSFLVTVIHSAVSYVLGQGLYYLGAALTSVLGAGLFYYFLQRIRGKPATVGDAFAGFTRGFFNLLAIGFLFSIFVSAGLVALLIPGIYLFVAYVFAPILAADKGLGFWDAMETSRRVVTRNWWRVAGLVLLVIPVVLLGCLALGVGIFVAIPVATGAIVYAYEDLCNPGG